MITGIGTDIIKLDRITLDEKFVNRILSKDELTLYKTLRIDKRRVEFLAGRFAAKEALAKALGSGIRGFNLNDIAVVWDKFHKPVCEFRGLNIHVSISHSNEFAVAFVIIEE